MTATMTENVRVVRLGQHTFYLPFVDEIPFPKDQQADLKTALQEAGKVEVRVILWKQRDSAFIHWVVDGAHRVIFAAELGFSKDDVPTDPRSFDSLEAAKDYCERVNCWRRQLPPSYLDAKRAERIARVAAARAEGDSLGTIAHDEGVSIATVRRDLADAPGVPPPGTPETQETPVSGNGTTGSGNVSTPSAPTLVTGKDGKKYPVGIAKIKCDNCKAKKLKIPDCPACNRLREAAVKDKEEKEAARNTPREPGDDDGEPLKDALGREVPENVAEAFAAVERFKAADSLAQQMQKEIDAISKGKGGEQLRRQLQPTGAEGKTINKSEHLNALKRDLKFTRPHAVCPYCNGKAPKSCKGCAGTGWVSKLTWDNTPDDVKAEAV